MKYLSIDTETTGLDTERCQVIEFSAVLFDTESWPSPNLPSFKRRIKWDTLHIERYCYMSPNTDRILTEIYNGADGTGYHIVPPSVLGTQFFVWTRSLPIDGFHHSHRWTLCGKNVAGFDLPMLRNNFQDFKTQWHHHRFIDPAPYYYQKGDDVMPQLNRCIDRSELFKDVLSELTLHDSWNDAYAAGCLAWEGMNRGQTPC